MRLPIRHRTAEFRGLLLLLCVMLASSLATARSTDRDQPLEVDAQGLEGLIDPDGDTVLTEVTITQGSLRIQARRATLTRSDGEVTRVVLEGNPASLQQENDAGQQMQAKAHRIEYDTTSEMVLLIGSVRINQGRDEFRGEQVRYDTRRGHIAGEGGAGGRVQLTIHPKNHPTAD